MRMVVDTNVIVSAVMSPHWNPARIIAAIRTGAITICYDGRMLAEYGEVLLRPEFGFENHAVVELLDEIEAVGLEVSAQPLPVHLPDPDDEMFLEVAIAAHARGLVTGNLRHFPPPLCCGVNILTPSQCVDLLRLP